jgi:cellulose synthase/poly-beta-1,6-N-acetylglucosamine synthase-like glycosyltransferase
MLLILFSILILTASTFIPKYVVILLVINLIIGLFLSIFQIIIALLPNFNPKCNQLKTQPFVSIFVPAYNEPPVILMQTLESLSRLEYNHFEVLVIDNNTKDTAVWKPVKAFIGTLGPKFRFFHLDRLSGFKAGALNYLLNYYADKKSEFVSVIDADYIVKPDFLKTALPYFSDEKIALVQFPQRYRNRNQKNEPLADEYGHFFGIYMNMANYFDCVPSTGTMSVYKLDVLKKIGGFRGEVLTEDADVGLRIYGAGYRGIYIDCPIGYGLMPYDLEAYRKQKWRWSFGNAQSLKTLFMLFGKIPFRSWIGFLSHLTAWHHFHFLPFAVLAAFPIIIYSDIPITQYHKQIFIFAFLSIFMTLASKMLLFLVTLRKEKKFFIRAFRACSIHMGMTLVYSEAWIACIFKRKFSFERTNKFVLKKKPSLIKNSYGEFILGSWYLLGAAMAILWGNLIVTVAFFIVASVLFSIYYVYWKISPTKLYSKKMLAGMERKYRPFIKSEAIINKT